MSRSRRRSTRRRDRAPTFSPISSAFPSVLPVSDPNDTAAGTGPSESDVTSGVRLRAQTLGAARVLWGPQLITPTFGLQFALLVRLLHTPGFRVPRAELFPELWPDQPEARQRGNLRQLLYKLRTMGMAVSQNENDVILDREHVEAVFCVDRSIEHFDRDVTRGDEPFGLWLPGYNGPGAAYARWLSVTRDVVHADVRRVLVTQLRRRRERGDWTGAEVLSRWLLQFDPLNEDATLTIAECVMMNGAKAEAVAILDRYLEELGPDAGDIRLPASQLRRRFTEPSARRRPSLAATERHFMGREQEMAELTMQLRRARWHDGSAVLLHGPAGIGKTRLCTELGKVAQIEGYREVTIECRESDQHRPLGVVMEILPELMSYPGALGCSPESLTVLRRLVGGDLPDQKSDQEPDAATPIITERFTEDIDAVLRSLRSHTIRNALVDLVGALSDDRPIYLQIEDLQWVDDTTWDILTDLIKRVGQTRLMLVATCRYSTIREGNPRSVPTRLIVRRLEPLAIEACQRLTRAIGSDLSADLNPEIEQWIISNSGGAPLLLRALVEHWVINGDATGVPPTLASVIDQRLDRLPPAALRALQLIDILGRNASLERIRAILGLPTHDVVDALERLEESGCLAKGDASLVVSHDVVARAASKRLSRIGEATLRLAAASHYEQECRDREEKARLLDALENLSIVGSQSDVTDFLLRNELDLLDLGAPIAVLTHINRVFDDHSEQTSQSVNRLRNRLELEAGEYRRALGGAAGTIDVASTGLCQTDIRVDDVLTYADSAHRADPIVDRDHLASLCASIAEDDKLPLDKRLRASAIGITICANTCDSITASRCFSPVVSSAVRPQLADAETRSSLLYHAIFGDLSIASRLAKSILDAAATTRPSTQVAIDCGRAAFTLRLCGEFDLARSSFFRQFEIANQLHTPKLAEFPAWQLALIALDAGDMQALSLWNGEIDRLMASNFDPIAGSFLIAHKARCEIEAGRPDSAKRFLDAARNGQPRFPTAKATAYLVALEIGIALVEDSGPPNRALLESAIEKHRLTASYGTSDYLTGVLCSALVRCNESKLAKSLMFRYLNEQRRERGALPLFLRAVVDRVL